MDASKIIGLGILGYLLLTSKKKVELESLSKDLENKNKELEEKLQEKYDELDQYTEKKEDLVIKPELHIDIDGGIAMSYLYLNIKNNSTKLTYKIGDISAQSIVALAYTANTFEPKKLQTLTIKPGKSYRLLIWSRNTLKQGAFNYLNSPQNIVFLPPQSDYFHADALNEISNYPKTYKVHKTEDGFLFSKNPEFHIYCYEFSSGLTVKQLNATVYSSNDEKQEVILNDIEGSLFIYTTNFDNDSQLHFPNYEELTSNSGYCPYISNMFVIPGDRTKIADMVVKYYYNPEKKSWEESESKWIGENQHVFK